MALSFSGSSYLTLNVPPVTAAPCSFACWFNPSQVTVTSALLGVGSGAGGHKSSMVAQTSATSEGQGTAESDSGTFASCVGTQALSIGTWYHILVVFSSTTSRTVYVNGANSGTNTTSISPTSGNISKFSIGTLWNNNLANNNFIGSIAFPAVWNSALGSSDATALYGSGLGVDPRTVQAGSQVEFSLLSSTTPVETVTTTSFTVTGVVTLVSDPFSITGAPTVSVQAATSKTVSSATLNGTIVNAGTSTVTTEGFNWGLTNAYGHVQSTSGSYGTGAFYQSIAGLAGGTQYHYQAFATNSAGTGTSADITFFTVATSPVSGEVLLNGNQIGTPGSYAGGGTVIANLQDANNLSLWLSPDSSGDWSGMDAGSSVFLTRVRLSPHGGFEDRVVGAIIQANASDPTFTTGNVNLYTISTRPNAGTLVNEYELSPGIAYRYYRYLPTGYGDLGDLDFICSYAAGVVAQCVTPVVFPPGGQFDQPTVVTISCVTTTASIYYTLDGSTPTVASTLYTGPFVLGSSLPGKIQLNAIAAQTGGGVSASRVSTSYFYVPSTVISTDDIIDSNRGYRVWAMDGCIFQDPLSNFWYKYGENTDTNGVGTNGGIGISCYQSADLRNWSWQGLIISPPAGLAANYSDYWLRPWVLYNAANNWYVLWEDEGFGMGTTQIGVSCYTSPSPTGPWTLFADYTALNGIDCTHGSDHCLFLDSDGVTAYLVISQNTLYDTIQIAQLSSDYRSVSSNFTTFVSGPSGPFGQKSEAHSMFKRNGVYFWQASGSSGWAANKNLYVTSTNIFGPWSAPLNAFQQVSGGNPNYLTAFDSQNAGFLTIPGRGGGQNYIWMGDRWDNGLASGTETSTTANFQAYKKLIMPVSFPTSTTMQIVYNDGWTFDDVFPTVSGAPSPATGLTISAGALSWVNNEPNPVAIYLDYSATYSFGAVTRSEVISSGTATPVATYTPIFPVIGGVYRIRTVNANGTSNSNVYLYFPPPPPAAFPSSLQFPPGNETSILQT